jgi:hypothetical protein
MLLSSAIATCDHGIVARTKGGVATEIDFIPSAQLEETT